MHSDPHTPWTSGGGTLFTEPVVVVKQKAKLVELTNEYAVFDQHGTALGHVAETGQSSLRKVLRFVTKVDQYLTHRFEIRGTDGEAQLLLTRPAKVVKSRVIVDRPDGARIGEIVQQNVFGKINFTMEADGKQVGSLKAQNWRAWDFVVHDRAGAEVARITKSWEGLAKAAFTTADNYVLRIHRRLPDPLHSLVLATALTVDTALKQDSH